MAIHKYVTGEYVYTKQPDGTEKCEYVKYDAPKLVTTHVGRVFRVYQSDYQAMSDVYTLATFAEVLSDDLLKIERILVNANFECDRSGGRAEADATFGAQLIKKSL